MLAVGAGAAIANVITGDGTLVGTSGNDIIKTGNGKDFVYALQGADVITGGSGNDVLDGDGSCMKGNNNSLYCQDNQDPGDQGDTITDNTGGNETAFGGGGHNTITLGNGNNNVWGGPLGDTITVGTGTNVIHLDYVNYGTPPKTLPAYTGSTVTIAGPSMGHDTVYAHDNVRDVINCNGTPTTVYADKIDLVSHCSNVVYTSATLRATKHKRSSRKSTHKRVTRR